MSMADVLLMIHLLTRAAISPSLSSANFISFSVAMESRPLNMGVSNRRLNSAVVPRGFEIL